MYIERNIAVELGFEFAGSGVSGGVDVKYRMEVGSSTTIGGSASTTTGYELNDDDIGDYFSVDILKDYTYGTPVFRLASGRSSCPWEEDTQPRDGVQLTSDSYDQFVTNPDDPAIFRLSLGNTSESDEDRTYNLTFLQESNPDGAMVTLGGSQVQGGIPTPYTIPAGSSLDATVTVSRSQVAYDYNNLQFVLSSPCDGSISDKVSLSAHFQSSCSDISFNIPQDNWLVNMSNNNILHAQLEGYDVNNIETVEVESSITDANNWTAIAVYDVTQMGDDNTPLDISFAWAPDGKYDIRAKVTFNGEVKYSDILSGIVDRTPLHLFGVPEPVDKVLNPGDLISAVFDDDINCIKFSSSQVTLTDITQNLTINTTTGCSGDKIIIIPDTAGLTFQNDTFRVVVTGIEDMYGNIADDVSWVFNVQGPESFVIDDDEDSDDDLIINSMDNCPYSYNPDQEDLDSDGEGDTCDDDIDGDNVNNISDNCPYSYNPNQEDTDSDGVGDVCENIATGINSVDSDNGYKLFNNYPNPFREYTVLKYSTPIACEVEIRIYNITGQIIAIIPTGISTQGINEINWFSRNQSNGIYVYEIYVTKPDKTVFTNRKKMILLR